MSQENVEIVRRIYEAFNQRDLAPGFELVAPDFEWIPPLPLLRSLGARPRRGAAVLGGSDRNPRVAGAARGILREGRPSRRLRPRASQRTGERCWGRNPRRERLDLPERDPGAGRDVRRAHRSSQSPPGCQSSARSALSRLLEQLAEGQSEILRGRCRRRTWRRFAEATRRSIEGTWRAWWPTSHRSSNTSPRGCSPTRRAATEGPRDGSSSQAGFRASSRVHGVRCAS